MKRVTNVTLTGGLDSCTVRDMSKRPSEKAFKARALRIFLRANPDINTEDLVICWAHYSPCVWANGEKGTAGHFMAQHPGYRGKMIMVAWYANSNEMSVR